MEVWKVISGEDFFPLPKWEFSTGKKISCQEKKQENDVVPSEKYACYAPALP